MLIKSLEILLAKIIKIEKKSDDLSNVTLLTTDWQYKSK